MDVNTLLLLLRVVEAGSLAEAARRTGVPKSTLSRRLRELENELGVRLLQRTTRQLGLTEQGRRLIEPARSVAAIVESARRDLRARGDVPRGPLRVTASVSLGERILLPTLLEFTRAYPEIQLELVLDPGESDLIAEGIDVAVRIGHPDPRSSLIAHRIAEAALYPCASPAYLEARGAPPNVDALREHDGILYRPGRSPATFVLEDEAGVVRRVTPKARLVVNSHPIARAAALEGLGVALLPAPFARDALADGRLRRVLPPLRTPLRWVYAAFPSRDLASAARAFVDFVAARFDRRALLLD